MKKSIDRIDVRIKGEKVHLIGRARSDRGTRYTTNAVVVDMKGLSRSQRKAAINVALQEFIPDEPGISSDPVS